MSGGENAGVGKIFLYSPRHGIYLANSVYFIAEEFNTYSLIGIRSGKDVNGITVNSEFITDEIYIVSIVMSNMKYFMYSKEAE